MLVSTKEMLLKAKEGKYAVPNFVVWNMEMLQGVMDAVEELKSPVILGFGSGLLACTDIDIFASCMLEAAKRSAVAASVHWDHGRNFEVVSHAAELGFSSLMIDGSANDLEENIRITKEVSDKFKPLGIPIEAELGHIGPETNYEEALAHYCYTKPEEAKAFVERTGIDSLAVAIGNAHGVYTSAPQINYQILEEVRDAVDVPLVLHGASGIPDQEVQRCIQLGITKVNIHTELCQAAMQFIQGYEGAYMKLQQGVRKAVAQRAKEKIRVLGSDGKGGK